MDSLDQIPQVSPDIVLLRQRERALLAAVILYRHPEHRAQQRAASIFFRQGQTQKAVTLL